MNLHPAIENYVDRLQDEIDSIPDDRRQSLDRLASFVTERLRSDKPANLVFICTHNSRRSVISEVWARVAFSVYDAPNAKTYSGGTEATAVNPRTIAALERAGFKTENPGGENPHCLITFADGGPVMECFSKVFDHASNPSSDFAAVMTCSDADENCPYIPGATRFSLPYDDPKIADGTPEERARYDERVLQIGREMFYLARQATLTTVDL